MKLTCPACSAKYTIADERLDGRRVKVRCKRCGEVFTAPPPVEPEARSARGAELEDQREPAPEPEPERAARRRGRDADLFAGLASAGAEDAARTSAEDATLPGAASHAPALTGERNESSVLFSLAALAKDAPPPPVGAAPSESSSLIDLRALSQAIAREDSRGSRADDIMNLGGGGAFASPLASPLAAPVLAPTDAPEDPRRRMPPLALASLALGLVAVLGVAAFAGARSSAATREPSSLGATAVTAPTSPSPSAALGPAATEEPSAPRAPLALAGSSAPSPRTSPVSAPAPRGSARASEARPVASEVAALPTSSATGPSPKCCPGESETACHMRLSVGAACGGDAQTSSPPAPLPAFDRPRAARALAVDVSSCKRAGGPAGSGHVRVTFQPSGAVSGVDVDAPYAGTAAGACVAQRYRGASVPAFSGGALTVGKTFTLE